MHEKSYLSLEAKKIIYIHRQREYSSFNKEDLRNWLSKSDFPPNRRY